MKGRAVEHTNGSRREWSLRATALGIGLAIVPSIAAVLLGASQEVVLWVYIGTFWPSVFLILVMANPRGGPAVKQHPGPDPRDRLLSDDRELEPEIRERLEKAGIRTFADLEHVSLARLYFLTGGSAEAEVVMAAFRRDLAARA